MFLPLCKSSTVKFTRYAVKHAGGSMLDMRRNTLVQLFICGDIAVLNSFAEYLFPNLECLLFSSIPFECLPSVRMWPKIQKWKNAKTQKSKNTKNTIPPECRYALVEWIVPSEVWDHHSVLPCLCRKHLDYKKKYMRCSLSNSASNCQGYDAQQHQTIRKHSVSWKADHQMIFVHLAFKIWCSAVSDLAFKLPVSCRLAAPGTAHRHLGLTKIAFWKRYFVKFPGFDQDCFFEKNILFFDNLSHGETLTPHSLQRKRPETLLIYSCQIFLFGRVVDF